MKFRPFMPYFLYLLIGVLTASCGVSRTAEPPEEVADVTTTPAEAFIDIDTPKATTGSAPIVAAPAQLPVTPTPLPSLPAGDPLPDDLAARFMKDLIGRQPGRIEEATSTIVESGDTRFIAVFLELRRIYGWIFFPSS